ncbi:MAG: glycosyltransferase family 2 protein [Planctomycetes bacterium]|nr:glycosyltransferase family 2 protein [Planctomycetota bacterium]
MNERPNRLPPGVGIVIPALNEAENLRALLPQLQVLDPAQIVIGDNGSTDGTAEVACSCGADVATEPKRGYGAACWAAMQQLRPDVVIVAFMDADLADDPAYLRALVEPIHHNKADLVIGWRDPHMREPGSMTTPQRFGNQFAARLIRWGWGFPYRGLGPFRAIRRSCLDRMKMGDRAYGWTVEMQARAVEDGLVIRQLSVPYWRRGGVSKISGTVRGVVLAGYWIIRTTAVLWWTRRSRSASRRGAGAVAGHASSR